MVGVDNEIAPGLWKSADAPTDSTSCYWARMDATTGEIINNHFGLSGIQVQVFEGEVLQVESCGTWFYVYQE